MEDDDVEEQDKHKQEMDLKGSKATMSYSCEKYHIMAIKPCSESEKGSRKQSAWHFTRVVSTHYSITLLTAFT